MNKVQQEQDEQSRSMERHDKCEAQCSVGSEQRVATAMKLEHSRRKVRVLHGQRLQASSIGSPTRPKAGRGHDMPAKVLGSSCSEPAGRCHLVDDGYKMLSEDIELRRRDCDKITSVNTRGGQKEKVPASWPLASCPEIIRGEIRSCQDR